LRIFLLDVHNEYGRCFGERSLVLNPRNLKLPFWLFNFEEILDMLFAGRPRVPEELDILAEVIPAAKAIYTKYQNADRFRGYALRGVPSSNRASVPIESGLRLYLLS
jgi:hypothetical protein